jgi:hypothetical protein
MPEMRFIAFSTDPRTQSSTFGSLRTLPPFPLLQLPLQPWPSHRHRATRRPLARSGGEKPPLREAARPVLRVAPSSNLEGRSATVKGVGEAVPPQPRPSTDPEWRSPSPTSRLSPALPPRRMRMMAHGCGGTGEDRGEGWRRARRGPTGAVVVTVRGEMGRVEANGRAVRGRGSSGGLPLGLWPLGFGVGKWTRGG